MSVQIYLNSQYATKTLNGTANTDLLFYFASPIIPPPNTNMTLKVLNLYVPVTFTLVNSSNNTLVVGSNTYTIASGNYNTSSLRTQLLSILPTGFSISFDSTTNKYTFNYSTSFTVSSSSTCLKLLGFAAGVSISSVGNSVTSTYPVDLTGDNMLFVDVTNLMTSNLSSTTGNRTSIVRSILMNVAYGGVLYYEDATGTSGATIQEDHVGFIHLRLYGEDGSTLVDLNNNNWSVTLEVGFEAKKILPSIMRPITNQDFYRQYTENLKSNA